MPPTSTAAKAERLLNLVIALVNTKVFRTAEFIRRNVAGYSDTPNDEAFNRMFERDKLELREFGIPLETDGADGYRIPPNEFSLPPLSFTPEETAAVGLAARLWSTTNLQSAGERAVRKLREAAADTGPTSHGGGAAGETADGENDWPGADTVLQPQVRTADPAFEPLQTATISRRLAGFDYRKQPDDEPVERRIQPWGLVSFRGRWFVIGHDLDRGAQRTFRLSRIVGPVRVTGKTGSYEIPKDVDLMEQVRRNAEPVAERTATLLIRPGRAVGLRRHATLVRAADDAEADDEVTVPIVGLWDTARRIVAAGPDVVVLEPADLRDAVIRTLRGALSSAAGDVSGHHA